MRPLDDGPGARRDESFLQRFHRRKLAARRGEALPDEPASARVATTQPPEPVPTDQDMPPIESLGADSDFSGFLSPGVSEELRRAALRRLWQVADLDLDDGLDIYAGDYTRFEPLGGLVTREMRRRLARAARREAEQWVDEPPAAKAGTVEAAGARQAALEPVDEVPQQPTETGEPDQEERDAG